MSKKVQEARWFSFYRQMFIDVCSSLRDVEFQTIYSHDIRTLHHFIDTNYPSAILTTLQNIETVTPAFVESALPLITLTLRHLKHILMATNSDMNKSQESWAKSKLEQIETIIVRVMYEILIVSLFHAGIQELAIQVLSELLAISELGRSQIIKKILPRNHQAQLNENQQSCFSTIFYIISAQKNNFKLIPFFCEILIQLSIHEGSSLTLALADCIMVRGQRKFTCLEFLTSNLLRLNKHASSEALKSPTKDIKFNVMYHRKDIRNIVLCVYAIAHVFCCFVSHSDILFKRIIMKSETLLPTILLNYWRSSSIQFHREDLARHCNDAIRRVEEFNCEILPSLDNSVHASRPTSAVSSSAAIQKQHNQLHIDTSILPITGRNSPINSTTTTHMIRPRSAPSGTVLLHAKKNQQQHQQQQSTPCDTESPKHHPASKNRLSANHHHYELSDLSKFLNTARSPLPALPPTEEMYVAEEKKYLAHARQLHEKEIEKIADRLSRNLSTSHVPLQAAITPIKVRDVDEIIFTKVGSKYLPFRAGRYQKYMEETNSVYKSRPYSDAGGGGKKRPKSALPPSTTISFSSIQRR